MIYLKLVIPIYGSELLIDSLNQKLISELVLQYCEEIQKPADERKSGFREENLEITKQRFERYLSSYSKEFEDHFSAKK